MVLLHLKRAVEIHMEPVDKNGAGAWFSWSFGGFDFGQGGNGYQEYHFENSNMGDMGDIFGDIFGNMFHGQKKQWIQSSEQWIWRTGAFTVVSEGGLEGHTGEKAVTSGLK